ncbi:MAG: delta-class carbonic anhydrase, partial [Prochlorococcaceae cyanobacterium]
MQTLAKKFIVRISTSVAAVLPTVSGSASPAFGRHKLSRPAFARFYSKNVLAGIVVSVPFLALSVVPARAFTESVPDSVINAQNAELVKAAIEGNFGPQTPRDISNPKGTNKIVFGPSPSRSQMNLCNIHFHAAAEHKGGEFTKFVGNGDGKGSGTGFMYSGRLTPAELQPISEPVGTTAGQLVPGSTVEIHFVHSTAPVKPGPTLGSCLAKDVNMNPQLRVETVVAVLVNDRKAADFREMAKVAVVNGYNAAPNIPENLGRPVSYAGSTTGPSWNSKPSPLEVWWNVRPNVAKVDILSVAAWLRSNTFNEEKA